jgi:phage anti-repressor protein
MNELVPVIEYQGRQAVNARDLHERLEVGKDFSTWIKDRIEKYGFLDGEDYQTCSPNLGSKDNRGGHNRVDYILFLQMAKEIAIVENNARGREIRRYLIKVEEAWNTPEMLIKRLQQMGALPSIDPFPDLSASKLREIRMKINGLRTDLKEERISVREYRRFAYGLDTPDVPDNPIKGALTFKAYDDFTEYKETHKKANPTVYSFAKITLKITGNPGDFVLIRDLYRLYRENVNSWEAETRNKLVRRIREMYPALVYKQKKVDGKPELVFTGCTLAE